MDVKQIIREYKEAEDAGHERVYTDVLLGYVADWDMDKVSAVKAFFDQIKTRLPNNKEMTLTPVKTVEELQKIKIAKDERKVVRNIFIRFHESFYKTNYIDTPADKDNMNVDVHPSEENYVDVVKKDLLNYYNEIQTVLPPIIAKYKYTGMVFMLVGDMPADAATITFAMANDYGFLRYDRPGLVTIKSVDNKNRYDKARTVGKRIFEELKPIKNFTDANDAVPENLSPNKAFDCSRF